MPNCQNPQCNKENVTFSCRRCTCASYCSKDCQKTDWKMHRANCNPPVPLQVPQEVIEQQAQDAHFSQLIAIIEQGILVPDAKKNAIPPHFINYSSNGNTLLQRAAYKGRTAWVTYLLNNGADVTKTSLSDETPLYMAATCGHLDSVILLLAKVNNIDEKCNSGKTPLWRATLNNHLPVISYLINHKANVNIPDTLLITPLWVAAKIGHYAAAKLLIKHKADINAANILGQTPLWVACKENNLHIVELLTSLGADLFIPGLDGEDFLLSPLEIAQRSGHLLIADHLQKLEQAEKLAVARVQSAAQEATAQQRRRLADAFFKRHFLPKFFKSWKEDRLQWNKDKAVAECFFKKNALKRGMLQWQQVLPEKQKTLKDQQNRQVAQTFFYQRGIHRGLQALRKQCHTNLLKKAHQIIRPIPNCYNILYKDDARQCLLQAALPEPIERHLALLHLLAKNQVTVTISGSAAIQYFWRTLLPYPGMTRDLEKMQPGDLDLIIDCSQQPGLESQTLHLINQWITAAKLPYLVTKEYSTSADFHIFAVCDANKVGFDKSGAYGCKKMIDITFVLTDKYCSNDPIHLTRLRLNPMLIRNLLMFQFALSKDLEYPELDLSKLIVETFKQQTLEIDLPSETHPPRKLDERLDKYWRLFQLVFASAKKGENFLKYSHNNTTSQSAKF